MNRMICTPHQKYSGDQIKKDVVNGLWWGYLKETDRLEELRVDENIIY
jgi:hypothetical protein